MASVKNIFISFASEDLCVAKILYDILSPHIDNLFFSKEVIPAGVGHFNNTISKLKESDLGIIILTKDSIINNWVAFEAGYLHTTEKIDVFPLAIEEIIYSKFRSPLCDIQIKDLTNNSIKDIMDKLEIELSDNNIEKIVLDLKKEIKKKNFENGLHLVQSEGSLDIIDKASDMKHIDVKNNHPSRWANRCRAYMTEVIVDGKPYKDKWDKKKRGLLKWEHRREFYIEIPPGETRTLDAFIYDYSIITNEHIISRNCSIDCENDKMKIPLPADKPHNVKISYKIIDNDFSHSGCQINIDLIKAYDIHTSFKTIEA